MPPVNRGSVTHIKWRFLFHRASRENDDVDNSNRIMSSMSSQCACASADGHGRAARSHATSTVRTPYVPHRFSGELIPTRTISVLRSSRGWHFSRQGLEVNWKFHFTISVSTSFNICQHFFGCIVFFKNADVTKSTFWFCLIPVWQIIHRGILL